MEFNEYQKQAMQYAVYTSDWYPVLGLAEEVGEVLGKYAKSQRGDKALDKLEVAKELGDCLWMIQACAFGLGYTLEEIVNINLNKLHQRQLDGVIRGNGDNR